MATGYGGIGNIPFTWGTSATDIIIQSLSDSESTGATLSPDVKSEVVAR